LHFNLDKIEQIPDNMGNTHLPIWSITMLSTRKHRNSRKVIRSDSRGRIPLGPKAIDKDFRIEYGEDGTISLIPVVFIPEREAWLYKDEKAIAQVRSGLADAASKRVREAGSFAGYADAEIE
jgi:hypothetical protein